MPGQERKLGRCVGNLPGPAEFPLSTSTLGDVAEFNSQRGDHVVVYTPNAGYLGDDDFTFRTRLGVDTSSATGTIRLRVRDCRMQWCGHEFE